MTSAFERRTRDARAALRDAGASGLVLFPSPNCYYLSGVDREPSERHFLLLVPAEGDPTFVVPEMSGAAVRRSTWVSDVRTWADGDDPVDLLGEVLDDAGFSDRVLVDDDLPARFSHDLRDLLPDAAFGLASEVLAPLRERKDAVEVEAMRRAGAVADAVSEAVRDLGADAIGRTEAEIAREIERRMRDGGASGPSFETIVASGPNAADPHHGHGDREVGAGDPVVLDFGCFLDNYASDQTRTVVFDGDPPGGFEDGFDAVLEAHHAGVEAVAPGVPAEDVDRAAREVIEDAGYGDAFLHRTGHGVGLSIHEPPYIVEGNDRPLREGMVFSVEPGIYLEGEFGVRVEDLVVVTDDGAERLNDSERGWRV